jgi:hypothetical protein
MHASDTDTRYWLVHAGGAGTCMASARCINRMDRIYLQFVSRVIIWKPANLLKFGTRVYVCNFSSSSEDDMVVIRPYVYYLVRRTDFLAAPALES